MEAAGVILTPPTSDVGEKFWLQAHPDFFYKVYELFGIKDSAELIQKAGMRPFAGEAKVFIIEIASFSLESANALLKTFEEPYAGTHFFIIAPSAQNIIPTLKSRLVVVENFAEGVNSDARLDEKENEARKFLAASSVERMKIIAKFFEDKNGAQEFLGGVEKVLEKSLGSGASKSLGGLAAKQVAQALADLQKCLGYLDQQGGSAKMVLEHLALVLPRT